MQINNLKIGADPELFLTRGEEVISAEGLIGGTKAHPKMISREGHAVQEDNVMVEFNVPPATNADDFKASINFVKKYIETVAEIQGLGVKISASEIMNPKYLETEQAQVFGCDPDFNAWKESMNELSQTRNPLLRSCGGHIHVGYNEPMEHTSVMIVKAMDVTLGLPSLFLDKDTRRRSLYGKAGSFRFKEYGVEYRTLSNFWITTDECIEWAFEQTVKAVELVNNGSIYKIAAMYGKEIERTINTGNTQRATELITKINLELTKETVSLTKENN